VQTEAMTLTDFLLARIAKVEASIESARTATPDVDQDTFESWAWVKRDRAECAAKRQIVENATNMHTSGPDWDEAVRILAAIYSDHPDYREEWRP
jgi:hypothetical protein